LQCDAGYCQALQYCRPTFEDCEFDFECCSGKCKENLLGQKTCEPIGGCKTSGPTLTSQGAINTWGDLCSAGAEGCDCCSGVCSADPDGVLRCEKVGNPECGEEGFVCQPDGELCDTDCQCCSGTCDEARPPDQFGPFPKRCIGEGEGGGSGSGEPGECAPLDAPCSDPADCCSELCVPDNTDGECGFRCADECVPVSGACTTSADCCGEIECLPDGLGGLYCGEFVPPA